MLGSYVLIYIYNSGYHCGTCTQKEFDDQYKALDPNAERGFDEWVAEDKIVEHSGDAISSYPDVLLEGTSCEDAGCEIGDSCGGHPDFCEDCGAEL